MRVFQPYKHYHSQAVQKATRLGCAEFDKLQFLSCLKSICEKTFKKTTILSAFRACGLIPFNPDIVLNKLRASSLTTDNIKEPSMVHDQTELFETELPDIHRTPSPNLANESLTTPRTARSLKRLSDKISSTATFSSPSKRQLLQKFQKGAIIQATAGSLAKQHMANTTAAEKARTRLTRAGKRRVRSSSGILYAGEARSIQRNEEEEEIRKAEGVLRRAAAKVEKERERLEKEAEKTRRELEKKERQQEKEEKQRQRVQEKEEKVKQRQQEKEEKDREREIIKEQKLEEKCRKVVMGRFKRVILPHIWARAESLDG